MTKNIFFSYAWNDRPIAMRIYWDLIRSNLNVWRDQIDGEPSINFKTEFISKIKECDFFILLDSENYRYNSNWCKTELMHFLKFKKVSPSKKIIVCLVQQNGSWRDREKFFIKNLNLLKYIDFSLPEIYDNDNKYEIAINEIINILGSEFVPWYRFPFEKDFEDELSQFSNQISDNDRIILLNDYNAIRSRKSQGLAIDNRLEIFLSDTLSLGIKSIFPYLLLGIYKADCGKFEEASEIFRKLIIEFPKDARGYRGLGALYFYLKEFDKSIFIYKKGIEITEEYGNLTQKEYLFEFYLNLSSVFIEIEKYEECLIYCLKSCSISQKTNKRHPQLNLNLDYCYEAIGDIESQKKNIKESLNLFWGEPEIHNRYAKFCFNIGNIEEAITHYKYAYRYDKSIRNTAVLALTYFIKKDFTEFSKYSELVLQKNITYKTDYYYLGLIFFLNGNFDDANIYYLKSESKDLYYNELIT